jgi:hypothetical protein
MGMADWTTDALQWLADHVRPDGGWSYYADGDSAIEPTATAVAALHAHDASPDLRRGGVRFLLSMQQSDGSMRPQPSQPVATALGAMAAVVLAVVDSPSAAARRVADYLLSFSPQTTERSSEISNDSTLRGFAWTPGTFSWVEPTAYGLLLLDRLDLLGHPRADEARRALLDRTLPAGGWNYGNSIVYGHELEPDDMPSALALLALWSDRASQAVTRGVEYLRRRVADISSPLSLAWCAMALRARGIDEDGASWQRFGEMLSASDRAAGSPWHRAAALLAAGPLERNPFVLGV